MSPKKPLLTALVYKVWGHQKCHSSQQPLVGAGVGNLIWEAGGLGIVGKLSVPQGLGLFVPPLCP